MSFFILNLRRLKSLIILLFGNIRLIVYRIQYGNNEGVHFGRNMSVHGPFYFKIKGKAFLGDNVTFTNLTRFNPVGIYKCSSIFVSESGWLSIGHHTGFSGVSIVCNYRIQIGDYCNFGGNVSVWDTDFHPLNYIDRRSHNEEMIANKPIVIGDDVFIGANSIILKGAIIGDRAIIGAGSVITCEIPSDEIWAGNPAKFIKKCF